MVIEYTKLMHSRCQCAKRSKHSYPPINALIACLTFSLVTTYIRAKEGGKNKMACEVSCLLKKPTLIDFLLGKLIAVVPFVTAIIAIAKYSETFLWILIYIGIFLLHAIHIYLKRCPHCAYYKIGGSIHRCHYIYGVPKIAKEKSGSPSRYLRIYSPIAIFVITLFPVYWLLLQWELLIIYALSWGVLAASLIHECGRCIYFECSMNRVPEDVRKAYLDASEVQK